MVIAFGCLGILIDFRYGNSILETINMKFMRFGEPSSLMIVLTNELFVINGAEVDIPIIPQAYQYLQTLWQNRNGKSKFAEYVLPELAQMYLHNRSSVP